MFTAPDLRARRRLRGLTLLEVVVGLTVLALMSGAIYAIVGGSVDSTAALQRIQSQDRRMETFLHRCRAAFAHLPSGATVELRLLENEPLRQELTLRGVPEAFVWGDQAWWAKPVVTLAPQRWPDDRPPPPGENRKAGAQGRAGNPAQPGERFSLAMTVPDFFKINPEGEPEPDSLIKHRQGNQFLTPDEQGRFWFELLPEVTRVEWRFWDPAKKIWVDQHPAGRPPMIELLLTLPGSKQPIRSLFQTSL
jgi:prepilin-type N-terminal cleavage/methylation domain-containing protein